MPITSEPPCWISQLTPRGTGAIAVIAVGGPQAEAILRKLFRGAMHRPVAVGRFGGEAEDTVVLVQGQGVYEVHCHGGPAVTGWILGQLLQAGAVEVSAQEWFHRQGLRPLQAAAAEAIPEALTLRTAGILLDQYYGAFEKALAEILADLQQGRAASARACVAELLQVAEVGLHLTRPWRVVVTGRPNVGKSSLVNALLGYERTITSPIPGTTRDVVASLTALDGWPIEFVDTAGVREAIDPVEAEGVVRALQSRSSADLVIHVLDRTAPEPLESDTPSESDHGTRTLVVVNKADLPAAWHPPGLLVSALNGEGISELMRAIVQRLIPLPPAPGAAVPFLELHQEVLEEVLGCLDEPEPDLGRAVSLLRSLLEPGAS